MTRRHVVVVGGTSGIGYAIARSCVERGDDVTVTGRDADRARAAAESLGGRARGLAVDLSEPAGIGAGLADVPDVDHLLLLAVVRDSNSVREYDVRRAQELVTIKAVGYTEVVHQLSSRLSDSVVLFGGLGARHPYPGSTTVTTVNGAVAALARTLALELAPVRVNVVHPGLVGDSPAWQRYPVALDAALRRTPVGRLPVTDDVVGAVHFLMDNRAINGIELPVDGGMGLVSNPLDTWPRPPHPDTRA